jgi:hypothetical protein
VQTIDEVLLLALTPAPSQTRERKTDRRVQARLQ